MNKPAHDHRLSLLAGEWAGEELIAASKWGPGGKAMARISARLDLDDRALVQDYRAERDGKPWLRAHAVFAFDEQSAVHSLFWFDSLGFIPAQPAPGHWENETLIFTRVSPRGMTRHRYRFPAPSQYQLVLESSLDGGASWMHIMQGSYSKVT